MAVAYNSKIVTNGLVMYLDAGNTQSYPGSGTTWTDLSGGGVTAALTNGPTFSSNNKGFIAFDGGNDLCSISPVPAITGTAATFCVWNYGLVAKPSTLIWLQNSLKVRQFSLHLPWSDGTIYFDGGNANTENGFNRIGKIATSVEYLGWHHWTCIKDSVAQTMSIYRNGLLWHSGSGLAQQIGTVSAAYIGTNIKFGDGSFENFHQAYISNLQFYNRALSQTEIQQNFNATRARFGV